MAGRPHIRWAWVFLDTPRADAERSWAFWSAVTGQTVVDRRGDRDEFATLAPARGGSRLPARLLLQSLGETDGEVRAHVDLACADRRADVARHVLHGARVVAENSFWTVMEDAVGRVYCLTDRSPQPVAGV